MLSLLCTIYTVLTAKEVLTVWPSRTIFIVHVIFSRYVNEKPNVTTQNFVVMNCCI